MALNLIMAIDPGTKATGWATFLGDKLHEAGLVRAKDTQDMIAELKKMGWAVDEVVVEYPQVYPGHRADPNDLIGLALISGAAATLGDTIRLVRPLAWKGQIPKEIHHRRIFAQLDMGEQRRINLVGVPKSLIHNVNDAIGLGLWAVGRM